LTLASSSLCTFVLFMQAIKLGCYFSCTCISSSSSFSCELC
jgi:hypothetical protein